MANEQSTKQTPAASSKKRRSEKAGVLNFTREMVSALLMAFIAIVYVIQAFRIPTGSMENSLLVGDFLLGLKFIYGAPVLPFTYAKFPGITDPKPGDVIIFKYPGADKKDYIKRCVAGPGQTIEVKGKDVFVDGTKLVMPKRGKHERDGMLDPRVAHFKSLRIPAKGDTLYPSDLPVREFLFAKHLIHQEHPRKKLTAKVQLYIDGEFANSRPVLRSPYGGQFSLEQIDLDMIDNWTMLSAILEQVKETHPDDEIEIKRFLYLEDEKLTRYIVKNDNYFMMGDNRDNSMDSRFWGYLNRNFVKAKAFILYFSLAKYYEDKDNNVTPSITGRGEPIPWILLPIKIRWNRIGKLIRAVDLFGEETGEDQQVISD